jgi:hypothetical protein
MKGLNFEEYVIVVFVMSPFYEKGQYTLLRPDAVPATGTAYLPVFFCGYLCVCVCVCVCLMCMCVFVCGVKFIVSLLPQVHKEEAASVRPNASIFQDTQHRLLNLVSGIYSKIC